MGDYARGRLDLDDEDRLPWLEPAIEDEEEERLSPVRLLAFILAGLLLIGAVVAGIWWIQNRAGGAGGEGKLIEAPAEDYKLAAKDADARKFAGEGDASFAASEGVARDGRIDPSRVPEAPITATRPAPADQQQASPAKPAQSVTTRVTDETQAKPVAATVKAGAAGGTIQLGAYGNQAFAKDAWKRLSKRFAYLEPLPMSVESAQVGGGTVYRLRAAAGAEASAICGKLKVAGESCMVVN
ncbi:SPOR domain-containing protein [Sphingobium cloacae]|uniref:Sporulation domain-containing protein n=1 Tax=Sphingobium cloacae TaxID=120107 RepID=A0A1E1F631_9SPHN|nr:SPOR domain-containing protein [Sphingobium cloacae]BAV65957.1 sporulation domain-containing protein [Sphingobium cloacae]